MRAFTPHERKTLFDGENVSPVLPYEQLDSSLQLQQLIMEGNGRLSISGAQEKYALVVDDGCLRLTRRGEQGRFILKPAPTDRRFSYRDDMPANENVTMQIAHEVYGIRVAAHGLVCFGNGQLAYLTRRFDYRPDGDKVAMEDFASLAGLNRRNSGDDFKYSRLSYEECAEIIKRYCSAPQIDLLVFFRMLLFNYLVCNADAHLKNFSLIEASPGVYRLSPAYDLLNTVLHLPAPIFALEKGLFRDGRKIMDTTPIGRPMFEEFGRVIGLQERLLQKELDFFALSYPQVEKLIESSELSRGAKQSYLADYHYRLTTMKK